MLIQVNTDDNVKGDDALSAQVEAVVRDALDHVGRRITRVQVFLSDENSDKKRGTTDMRCLLEARPAGLPPISVSEEAATLEQAVEGAARKLKDSVGRKLGRLEDR